MLRVASLAVAQAGDAADWQTAWRELESKDDFSDTQRMVNQVNLLKESGAVHGWADPEIWEFCRQTLDQLELSPDIGQARESYLSLILAMGSGLGEASSAVQWEERLREYYQRGLGIAVTPSEEGQILLYLAESMLRSQPGNLETYRRVESLLQQATDLLPEQPPRDIVHLRLALLYEALAKSVDATKAADESYLSRAVFHNRFVLDMEGVRESVRAKARAALDELLQPGLQVHLKNRFLPQSDIGVTVATRNILELTVEVFALPWTLDAQPLPLAGLRNHFMTAEPTEADRWVKKTFKVTPNDRFAWEESVLRLGEALPGGWYWLRVNGGGLSAADLLLVTPLELTVLPRQANAVSFWAVDAETGGPIPSAIFHVLDSSGSVIGTVSSNADGLAEIELPEDMQWEEVHVTDGINPGFVERGSGAEPQETVPVLIPGSLTVQPGSSLSWILSSPDSAALLAYEESLSVKLPDGRRLDLLETEPGPGILKCSVLIPEDAEASGPLYLVLPGGTSLLLTHLQRQQLMPFELTFSGDRIEAGKAVFLASAPVRVQINRNFSRRDSGPEFLRLRISPLFREFIHHGRQLENYASREALHEEIIRIGPTQGDSVTFELPAFPTNSRTLPLVVEVLSLEGEALQGRGILALSPYRSLVSLRVSEQIVMEGGSVTIDLETLGGRLSANRLNAGELAIYRETWESRYIHRKRGTLLTESEYLALPDRSLLGSAKTDYRLQEGGFIRESVDRISVGPATKQAIPVQLEKSGYYQIEFEGREQDFRAFYPEGPLEVWVLPESGDLRAFRSETPRLIHERDPGGFEQILVLLDRKDVSVLLDLEFDDGSLSTEVLLPDANALYRVLGPGSYEMVACHAVISGGLQSTLKCLHLNPRNKVLWDLDAERTSGLNPGSTVDWSIRLASGEVEGPVLWGIYPDGSDAVLEGWLREQDQRQLSRIYEQGHSIHLLGQSLPLYDPLGQEDRQPSPGLTNQATPAAGPRTLYALSPVLVQFHDAIPEPDTLHTLQTETASANIEARLPSTAGRWQFMVFYPDSDGTVDWQHWGLSTELPIRTAVEGPSILRLGDQAIIPLTIENTTRREETLQIILGSVDAFSVVGRDRDVQVLESGQRALVPVEILAEKPGPGQVLTRAEGSLSSSEATYSGRVAEPALYPDIRAFLVMPATAAWDRTIALPEWSEGKLLVSSGLGSALTEIWPLLRKREAVSEPLLAALGDWALERVRLHHGILSMSESGEDSQLAEQLQRFASGGGWSWTPGNAPDPWLSALVLWSLETFSGLPEDAFSGFRETASEYLEAVLIDESVDRDARLFALRSLAVPAFHDPRIRPSRIQAKSFLEFLHQRDQLSNSQLASLLQVARAFRFSEEVRLLIGSIKQRFNSPSSIAAGSFWSNSLVYLALAEGASEDRLRQSILSREFEHLTQTGPTRSWEQFGGFMNLLAAFLWEGDFNIEGQVRLSVEESDPLLVSLRPHGDNKGRYFQQLDSAILEKEAIRLQLDASAAQSPVAVVLMGQRPSQPELAPYPEQSVRAYREFVEATLLSGSRQRIIEFSDGSLIYPGDTLQLHLSLYVEETEHIAELEFALPAGASLAEDAIQYSFEASPDKPAAGQPDLTPLDNPNPLRRVLRMEPFAAGRHDFILSYRINWAGKFSFPQNRLLFPRTGQVYSIGNASRLEITPVAN